MNFVDSVALAPSFRLTNDGYLVGEVKCARTGVQAYTRKDLGLQGDGLINVYRPEEAVFNKDSMKTFVGKPVTIGHPTVAVTSENWRDLAVGQVGTDVARDGETVKVSISLMDQAAIDVVKSGTREISMGYFSPVEMRDGVAPDGTPYQAVQTGPIRINHLAVVDKARGGEDLKIHMDQNWGTSPAIRDHKEKPKMQRIVFDGITIEVNDQAAEAIAKLQKSLSDSQADLAKKDTELAKKDAELTAKDKDIADAKAAIPQGQVLDALVAERASIIDAARKVDANIKLDGKSNAEIKRAVVSSVIGDEKLKAKLADKSESYVDAFIDANFDIVVADKSSVEALAVQLGDRAKPQDASKSEEDAYNASIERFKRAKK